MGIYEELEARGLIAQVTNEEHIREMVNNGKATFYIGFDPTADSLHVGHFMALCLMKRLQMAGNKPIVLLGGGTGMIGDPSGRSDMRSMMTPEQIQHNCDCFLEQISRFIDFSDDKALVVNNKDWLLDLNYVEMLREVGPHFSVNRMLAAECYKQRMEKGLSFFEFNYMIMQSYDFYQLFKEYGCNMQFGGDDQWSNMLAGTELIRRKLGEDAHALTITLLLNSEGNKMGKTANGAVWLDPTKTTPFEFYQYWRNVSDADVLKCIRMLTFLPVEEIDKMDAWEGSQLNQAKEILAYELTKLVHDEEEAKKAQESAHALFTSGSAAQMPTAEVSDEDFVEGEIDILSLLLKSGLVPSKSEARRAVEQGGVALDGEKIGDIRATFKKDNFAGDGMVLRRGKKNFRKIVAK
ncbi:tyrosine--tRNA ligase [Lachnospiraceae bacterium OttesenSCG-928-E19]|nr:tyrosine--tRNA ligase [Lachnospiraceae bacterium OttesenSCG-928-E19]